MGTKTTTVTNALAACTVAACVSANAQPDRLALISNPTPVTHQELIEDIQAALGSVPITLADDAFTNNSKLSIERMPRRDFSGQLLNGRVLEKPEGFTLYLRGSRCVLIQDSTHREWVLRKARCVAR